MIFSIVLRIVETVVFVYCGSRLAVGPCEPRWDHITAKIIYYILLSGAVFLGICNLPYAKFSSTELYLIAVYLFIVLKVFYKISIWKLCLQNFIYWITLILTQTVVVFIVCLNRKYAVNDYLSQWELPWHWLHMLTIMLTMAIVILLTRLRKGKSLIECRNQTSYILATILIMLEPFIETVIFPENAYKLVAITGAVVTVVLYMALYFCVLFAFIIVQSNTNIRQREAATKQNLELLKQQYEAITQLYTIKRRQIHDNIYHDVLLLGYLEKKLYDQMADLLNQSIERARERSGHRYTGITAIDFILDYKMENAKAYDIDLLLDVDIYFCPFQDYEICIILGNLLDNAIEATQNLEVVQRKIYVTMMTTNKMFIMEIKNPYQGKRKLYDGKYETTKADRDAHGLGLESVKAIVDSYDGEFSITDKNTMFTVSISIFRKNKLGENDGK